MMPPRSKCYASSTALRRCLSSVICLVVVDLFGCAPVEAQRGIFKYGPTGLCHIKGERGIFFGCYQRDRSGQLELLTASFYNCLGHCEGSFFRYAALSDTQCFCFNTIRSRQIEDKECNLKCRQNEDQTCGGDNAQSFYETGVEVTGPVKNLKRAEKETENTIKVSWDPPALDGVPVEEFEINAVTISTFANYRLYPVSWTVHNNSQSFELSSLVPGTRYNVTVTSVSEKGAGGMAWVVAETEIGVPDPEPEEPVILRRLCSTIQIQIQKAINNNGPVNYYRVVVHYVDDDLVQTFDESLLDTYQRSRDKGVPYYIAAEVEMKDDSLQFTVGDKRHYRNFFNPEIPARKHVHISIGIVSILNGVVKVRYATTTHEQHQHPDQHHVNSTNAPERNETLITLLAGTQDGVAIGSSVKNATSHHMDDRENACDEENAMSEIANTSSKQVGRDGRTNESVNQKMVLEEQMKLIKAQQAYTAQLQAQQDERHEKEMELLALKKKLTLLKIQQIQDYQPCFLSPHTKI